MERKFSHYETWEDYKAGMYFQVRLEGNEDLVMKAKSLLSNPGEFRKTMEEMIIEWPICSEFNLTNIEKNRRAWLGQASCCFKYGVTENLTRIAWGMMDYIQQKNANNEADLIISAFESKYNIQCQKRLWE